MQELNLDYAQRAEDIRAAIQDSEALTTYLESEEPDDYATIKEGYEPHIANLYAEVADDNPLQLEALENILLDSGFEGLFLPRLLGYTTLRPRLNERGQYERPGEHLRKVLLAVAESNAFDELQKRIGQGLTTAFALSTAVWSTKLINDIANKRVRNFFENHNDRSIRTAEQRFEQYKRYGRQFARDNYATAAFPADGEELGLHALDLENFILYRVKHGLDNASLVEPITRFLGNDALLGDPLYERLVTLLGIFVELPDGAEPVIADRLRELREQDETGYSDRFFDLLNGLYHDERAEVNEEADRRMAKRIGTNRDDKVAKYYQLIERLHDTGIADLGTQDAVRVYVSERDGRSTELSCVRQATLGYFRAHIKNLDVENYTDFFDITKLFAVYITIFGSESFKQELRTHSLAYVKQLIRRYTDKRGRDYQDIKKFVTRTFDDLEFMTEKEIVNLFKTKRVRKPAST